MLRVTASSMMWVRQTSSTQNLVRRSLVTSSQKRALTKTQVEGSNSNDSTTTSTTPPATVTATATTSTPVQPTSSRSSSSSSSSSILMAGAVGAIALTGGAMAYRSDMLKDILPAFLLSEEDRKDEKTMQTEESVGIHVTEDVISAISKSSESTDAVVEIVEEDASNKHTNKNEESSGSRVTVDAIAKLGFPPKVDRPLPAIIPPTVIPNANKVIRIVAHFSSAAAEEEDMKAPMKEEEEEAPKEDPITPTSSSSSSSSSQEESTATTTTTIHTETAIQAAVELKSTSELEANAQIHSALNLLRKDMDEAYLEDLDSLSNSQLKIRLIRLASEVGDRARLEALRLKEMLSLKEKEIADKYLLILQQQRLQFEELLSHRLREQEQTLTTQSTEILQQKDYSIQSLIDASKQAQEKEHEADLDSKTSLLQDTLQQQYEADYANKMAEAKEQHIQQLQQLTSKLNQYIAQIGQLETLAQHSKTFETNSQKAHLISAAALALSQKLETNQPFAIELHALTLVSQDDQVISEALRSMVPTSSSSSSSSTAGVPTLPQLQKRFEGVYHASRQAAMVPQGKVTLGAQLMGILFSTLMVNGATAQCDDDANAVVDTDIPTAQLLSKIKSHVEVGNLEEALKVLDAMKEKNSQVAFTVQDWEKDAQDRVNANRCLKVLKLECALLNETMAK